MKHKNISYQSNNLLAFFLDKGKLCFTFPEVLEALPGISPNAARQLLSDMAKRGLLMRIRNGLYYIIPFDQDPEKLLDYCKRFDSQAVIKRLGFLLELLKIGEPIIETLQDLKTDSYILLDTEMEKDGKSLSRWSIRQNIDAETIENALLT